MNTLTTSKLVLFFETYKITLTLNTVLQSLFVIDALQRPIKEGTVACNFCVESSKMSLCEVDYL